MLSSEQDTESTEETFSKTQPFKWNVTGVCMWLKSHGLSDEIVSYVCEKKIDGKTLFKLDKADFVSWGISSESVEAIWKRVNGIKHVIVPNHEDEAVFLPPEVEHGNIEYKRELAHPTKERIVRLTSQLKWRLGEGNGEALYEIGVDDNGYPRGLSDEDLEKSILTLKEMAAGLKAEVSVVLTRKGEQGKIAEVLIREVKNEEKFSDVRYAVCGNVDSGKSTMIGVLISGDLDNGRGRARSNVFKHPHELETGRTMSIGEHIMGFNAKGECVNYNELHRLSWGDIIEESYKVITFLDLAGHERYLRITVAGMTGSMVDYSIIVVGANMGVTQMTKEHLGLATVLKIPIIIVISKIDLCSENVKQQTLADVRNILKIAKIKTDKLIQNEDDLMSCVKTLKSGIHTSITPIFEVSSVTGRGYDLLRKFLNLMPPRITWTALLNQPTSITIDQNYSIDGVGTVVTGTVISGTVNEGQTLLLGPDDTGQFQSVSIKSIQTKRVPVRELSAGGSGGFALKKIKRENVRRGMILIDPSLNPQAHWYFDADFIVLHHSGSITVGYSPTVHIMTIRQAVQIINIEGKDSLRTRDRAKVRFKFLYKPEYLKSGMRMIIREGRIKGIGVIKNLDIDLDTINEVNSTKSPPRVRPSESSNTTPKQKDSTNNTPAKRKGSIPQSTKKEEKT